jgi:hypothetical protein
MVLRLRKYIYGPKQSSHVSYGTFKEFVISIGFVASHVDGGLFMLEDQGIVVAAVVLYINNLLIIANESLIGQIKDQVKKRFRMSPDQLPRQWLCSIRRGSQTKKPAIRPYTNR